MTSAVLSEMMARAPVMILVSVVLVYLIAYLLAVLVNLLHSDKQRRADAADFLDRHPLSLRRRRK
ncbi:hypothetical protein [Streptomyces sp. NBC_00568]|uniref:hypothetical protein n=1 Tax=Streptomyces sp. NBC_00568 TaxID=2975779 RepID=UPI00225212DE|nr:hypothetical protein [Streptomyces sp. NBC_00568]MCX4989912.1 hypothetical protein [Streptomyces sp. NBC_00568]